MSSVQEETTIETSSPTTSLERLNIVSMNIAGCIPSHEAPSHWNQTTVTIAMRNEVLRTQPDILALQECPGGVDWATDVFDGYGYRAVGANPSHAGWVVLLVRGDISTRNVPVGHNLPAVVAELVFNGEGKMKHSHRLLISSVHLMYSKGGATKRKTQVEDLLTIALSETQQSPLPFIIAGDTNMRESEDAVMEGGTIQLSDAWKLNGSDPKTRYPWDTVNHGSFFNRYQRIFGILMGASDTVNHGSSFNRYYGEGTQEYYARYDRIYFKTVLPATSVKDSSRDFSSIDVLSFDLIANKPLTSKNHFLSDHFGLSSVINVTWK